MSQRVAGGSFPQVDFGQLGQFALVEDATNVIGDAKRTLGAVRVAQIQAHPSVMETWKIIGWSVRARLAFFLVTQGRYYARLGDLYAGIVTDGIVSNQGGFQPGGQVPGPGAHQQPGGAEFPQNLSTFDRIWQGSEDHVNLHPITFTTPIPADGFTPIGRSFSLPTPIDVAPSANFQFALILTPSFMGPPFGLGGMDLIVADCDFTIIYDDGH